MEPDIAGEAMGSGEVRARLPNLVSDEVRRLRVLQIMSRSDASGELQALEWFCEIPSEWSRNLRLAEAAWLSTNNVEVDLRATGNATRIVGVSRNADRSDEFDYLMVSESADGDSLGLSLSTYSARGGTTLETFSAACRRPEDWTVRVK